MTRLARNPAGVVLFSGCLAVEHFICGSARYAAAWPIGWFLLKFFGAGDATNGATVIALAAAWTPIALAAAAMLGVPGGGGLIRLRLGAREPSIREWELIDQALEQLDPPEKPPHRTYIVDSPTPYAHTIGQTLYIHRELLNDASLPAVIAHELGHIRTSDGRITLAMHRLAPLQQRRILSTFGGLSFILARHPLDAYWRGREYQADTYAADHGQAPGLADYLQRHQLFDIATPYQLDRDHPYTEQRLERLQALAEDHAASYRR